MRRLHLAAALALALCGCAEYTHYSENPQFELDKEQRLHDARTSLRYYLECLRKSVAEHMDSSESASVLAEIAQDKCAYEYDQHRKRLIEHTTAFVSRSSYVMATRKAEKAAEEARNMATRRIMRLIVEARSERARLRKSRKKLSRSPMLRFSVHYLDCIFDQIPDVYATHLSPEVIVEKTEKKCLNEFTRLEKAIINEFPSLNRKKAKGSAVKAKELVRIRGIELIKKFARNFHEKRKKHCGRK